MTLAKRIGRLPWHLGWLLPLVAGCAALETPGGTGVTALQVLTGEVPPAASPASLADRLKIPPDLPGADAPALPARLADRDPQERQRAVAAFYAPLPPLEGEPPLAAGPQGEPLTLYDLQQMALAQSPLIAQAAADVEAARGAALQAGLYPNPTVGYAADSINQGDTAGMQGVFLEQTIKTAGKLGLAKAAAQLGVANAELALRKAQADLFTQVRTQYFAALVARENLRASRALAGFTEEVYRIQVELLQGGEAAAYEPAQLRALTVQARGNVIQARNRALAAWRQLAATLNKPDLPPTELAGRADMPIPRVDFARAREILNTGHTDVLTAQNAAHRAAYNLRLAQVTPIPDVTVGLTVQKDFTTPPFNVTQNVQVGVPLPVFDRNQGNIRQAEAALARAAREADRVRNELTARLAEAFERYDNARTLLDYYRAFLLPDQIRAYRGAFERHLVEPAQVGFGDVVNAQQTLAATVNAYLTALDAHWRAVTDLAGLLQVDDPFQPLPPTVP